MSAEARILIVEDERAMAEGIRFNLRYEGFDAEFVPTAEAAVPLLLPGATPPVDLVLLDVMLPGEDGFALLERLRARGVAVPVVLLTARSADVDVIRGLELGADDYVTKPFSLGQLAARIRAVLRRARKGSGAGGIASGDAGAAPSAAGANAAEIACAGVTIDLERGIVRRAGEAAQDLTIMEAEILRLIARAPGRTASRNEILDRVWGLGSYPSTRTVDNHVARIRKKLEGDPAVPQVLVTVHGRGYRLVVPGAT